MALCLSLRYHALLSLSGKPAFGINLLQGCLLLGLVLSTFGLKLVSGLQSTSGCIVALPLGLGKKLSLPTLCSLALCLVPESAYTIDKKSFSLISTQSNDARALPRYHYRRERMLLLASVQIPNMI